MTLTAFKYRTKSLSPVERAYMMGFFYGLRKRQALRAAVNDSAFKEDEHPRDKDGKFSKGKASASVQSFANYIANKPELSSKGFRTQVKHYLKDQYRDLTIESGSGIPKGKKIRFTARGLAETASYINSDTVWVLPFLKDIYKKGRYVGLEKVKDGKHPEVRQFHVSEIFFKHNGRLYLVQAKSRELFGNSVEFDHYYVAVLNSKKSSK